MSDLIECRGCGKSDTSHILLSCLHSYCKRCVLCQDDLPDKRSKVRCPTCNKSCTINVTHENSFAETLDKITSNTWCRLHENEPWMVYCFTCARPLCDVCMVSDHSEHECYTLTEASKIKRYDLQNILRDFQSNVLPLKSALADIQQAKDAINAKSQSVAIKIRKSFYQLIQNLKEREEDLVKSLENVQKAKLKVLDLQEKDLERELNSTVDVCLFTDKLISQNNEVAIICSQDIICQRIAHIKERSSTRVVMETDDIEYIAKNTDTFTKAVSSLGRVGGTRKTFASTSRLEGLIDTVTRDSRVTLTLVAGDALGNAVSNTGDKVTCVAEYLDTGKRGKVDLSSKGRGNYELGFAVEEEGLLSLSVGINGRHINGSPFGIQCISRRDYALLGQCQRTSGSKGCKIGELMHPTSISLDQRQTKLFISDSDNHRIQVWKYPSLEPMYSFGEEGEAPGQFSYPYGLHAHNDSVIVADCNNHRVQVLNEEGKVILLFGKHGSKPGQLSHPYDIQVDRTKRILVSDSANHRIQIFTITGTPLKCIPSLPEHPFGSPWGLAVNSKNQIIVADFKLSTIQVFSNDGKPLHRILDEDVKSVAGIACDNEDNIILCDRGHHRIKVYDKEGLMMSFFGEKGSREGRLKYPSDVILDKHGFLIVCDAFNHRIQKF